MSDHTQPSAITASGRQTTLEGRWVSGHASDEDRHLSEVFTFDRDRLTIELDLYSDAKFETKMGSETIRIQYRIGGTLVATRDHKMVTANEVSGMQTIVSKNKTMAFKQSVFIDDRGSRLTLYHARFEADGGPVSERGFPTTIIPVAFVRLG